MRKLILIFFCFIAISTYGQFSQEKIITDSSEIEITRNSVYKVYEETYKNKDSIWWSVSYIDDTTQLKTEGWETKSKRHLGIWKEYNRQGVLMYTWNHETGICEVNKSMYPYHDLLEQMKVKTDSLIINTYSREFFDNHVQFEYECYAYFGHLEKLTFSDRTYWSTDYLGTWTEPIKSKPNCFMFRYQVRLSKSDDKGIALGMDLDSLGNYVPSGDDTFNNYGFEDVKGNKKTFQINKSDALNTAKEYGLVLTDSSIIAEFLTWENFKKQTYFNGQFGYYITDLTGKTHYTEGKDRYGIIYRYNVYSFNPWTGAFIKKKKMKSINEWEKNHGYNTGLLPDTE